MTGDAMKNNQTLLPAERLERILEILREKFTVRGSHLSELLGVSEMTIRRDLDILGKQGLVERTHGGAVFRQERIAAKFHYKSSYNENFAEKEQIARKAAAMIEPHDTIYIGEGSTAALIVRYMDPGIPCSLFTNNMGVVAEADNLTAEIIMLGGIYNPSTHALAGALTMEMITRVHAGKVFLGADGLSLSAGITTPNLQIAIIDRSMIRNTRGKVIVLANHSKFGLVAEMSIAPLKQIDILITNQKVPDDFQHGLSHMGVDVVIA